MISEVIEAMAGEARDGGRKEKGQRKGDLPAFRHIV